VGKDRTMSDNESDEPIGHVLGTGTWRDLLPRVPRPVFVVGSQQLYRVLIHGSGFSLPLSDGGEPISGFFTTRFVAASNVRDAEIKARSSVLREWKRGGYEARADSSPILELEDVEIVHARFRLRSGAGFTFFCGSPED
jgi:hypothetical protein